MRPTRALYLASVGGDDLSQGPDRAFPLAGGSEYLDELLDEAIVAIALTAYGHGNDWIQNGAWAIAESVVTRFELEEFVARLEEERIL